MIAAKKRSRKIEKPARHSVGNGSTGAPAAGFTLIEVLLALTVFSIGLLAVAGMQVSSVTKNTSSRMNTMAVEYAADYMERLLSLGVGTNITLNGVDEDGDGAPEPDQDEVLTYPQLAKGTHVLATYTATDHDLDGRIDITTHPEFDDIFNLTWTVVDDNSRADDFAPPPATGPAFAGESGIKWITVTVTWANGRKDISLTSIKSSVL